MKVITEINNLNSIKKYNAYSNAYGIIFSYTKFYTYSVHPFSLPEIFEIVSEIKKHHKLAILKIDKIIEEKELTDLIEFLDIVVELDIDYFIYTDSAVLAYFSQKKMLNKLIYSAKTLNCSYADALYYQKNNIKVIISNELSLQEIKHLALLDNVIIDGYGHSLIFYSKRPLLKLFSEHIKIENDFDDAKYSIKELSRTEKYPIYANENGTFIFTSARYAILEELKDMNFNGLVMIERMFVPEKELKQVLDVYTNSKTYDDLVAINSNLTKSFVYKKANILNGVEND